MLTVFRQQITSLFKIPVDVIDNYQILCVYFHVTVFLSLTSLSLNNILIRSFVLL